MVDILVALRYNLCDFFLQLLFYNFYSFAFAIFCAFSKVHWLAVKATHKYRKNNSIIEGLKEKILKIITIFFYISSQFLNDQDYYSVRTINLPSVNTAKSLDRRHRSDKCFDQSLETKIILYFRAYSLFL